jgi:hypothetical protein
MSLNGSALTDLQEDLLTRVRPNGGFGNRRDDPYRTDATAWGVIALSSIDASMKYIQPAIARLTADQRSDGCIGISRDHPEAFWPTSLAILALLDAPHYSQYQARAIQFLLDTTGRHWEKLASSPMAHNSALKGWPWIAETHSWVEPTALSMMALRAAGYARHPRIEEATRMLMDRHLPHGGWNCGNTIVFGQELRPAPESTGTALHALAGLIPREKVQLSLDYLSKEVTHLRTPISLGWSLLALNSWGVFVPNTSTLITDCLKRQERYGPYDTTSLCLLVVALVSPAGLLKPEKVV